MIQEFITYIIVAIALVITIRKTIKKFSKKKKIPANKKWNKETAKMQHKCDDCLAECILRDTVSPSAEDPGNFCKRIDITSSD